MTTFLLTIAGAVLLIVAHGWLFTWCISRPPKQPRQPTPHETLTRAVQIDVERAAGDGPQHGQARVRLIHAARDAGVDWRAIQGAGKWTARAEATRKKQAEKGTS